MRNKWKPKVTQTGDIIAKVSGSAAISVVGVANGRTIPVIIVLPDKENKIDAIINAHCGISAGDCESQWGCTFDHNVILLFLEFKNPVEARVIIPLDIIEYGAIIDQIIQMLRFIKSREFETLPEDFKRDVIAFILSHEKQPSERMIDNQIYEKDIEQKLKSLSNEAT